MKIALVVEDDPVRASTLQLQLKLLGYSTFVASTPARALNIVKVCTVDVILISAPVRIDERRSFAGELKSLLRTATVVLITDCSVTFSNAMSLRYSGLSAVMKAPCTLIGLWRALEYQRHGFGCHPGWVPSNLERRSPLRARVTNHSTLEFQKPPF